MGTACCVCIGGVNYTKSCSCQAVQNCCCGANPLAMSTSNPNPGVSQGVCGGDGGAGATSNWLNAVGKWGTVLTATLQGKPVAVGPNSTAIGARGATGFGNRISPNSMLLILIIIGGLLFLALRK